MSILRGLGRLHDLVTHASAVASALCLGAIALLYCSEVVSRYFLSAPTSWTAAVSIYLMLATVMLMLPYLTMTNDHVEVNITDYLPVGVGRWMTIAAIATSAIVCLVSAYFSYEEMARAYSRNVRTTDTLFIPKWWLLALLVYGLASATLHFVRRFWASIAGNSTQGAARA